MRLLESIELALAAIKANKMRSFLTMLGIIIGISSVITISTIGASAKGMVEDALMGTGADYVYITVDWNNLDGSYLEDDDLITRDEADRLKERMGDELLYYAPYVYTSGELHFGRQKAETNALGVSPQYTQCTTQIEMTKGRFISQADIDRCRQVLVIEDKAAEKLFGTKDPIGKVLQFIFDGQMTEFTVVGVYHKNTSTLETLLGGGGKFTSYMPWSIAGSEYQSAYLECYVNSEDPQKTAQMMADFFTRIKRKEPGFYSYVSQSSEMSEFNNIMDILSLAIGAIAAISLLVGGIGIMNIMLVSVTERTREIGIRKALGARTGNILWQFLVESMILSLFGGLIGIGTGIGVAAIAATVMKARLILEPSTVVIAVAFSVLVGIVFGLFPARKAAMKDPIEALRYE